MHDIKYQTSVWPGRPYKQANIYLAFVIQIKGDGGIQKEAKSYCSSRGYKVKAPQSFWWNLPFYINRAKTLVHCNFKAP